ncbi:MAG: 23S rRNA (guanosine(2251)-2'-O)-methyltransferase RlmB [Deltaproteobacteria bacterium]
MQDKITGINAVTEALQGGRKVEMIYLLEGPESKRITAVKEEAIRQKLPVKFLKRERMDQMVGNDRHQGIIALVEAYSYSSLEDVVALAARRNEIPFVVLLDEIEDPHNLGAIIRTAECAGVHGIIIPRHHAAEITPAVSRASAGAVEHMLVVKATNLVNVIKDLKSLGFWIVGADMEGQQEYFSCSIPTPAALVIGSEGKGIRRLVREHCDLLLRIPLYGKVNSLNASVAGALLIYEVIRQREMSMK